MTDYKKIGEGYERVREIHQRIFPELDRTREESGVFVYYVDKPFSSKPEDLVGLIISPEDYSTIIKFVFFKTVYRTANCKRLVGVDVEAGELEKVLRYGLAQSEYGKIVMRGDKLLLTQEKLLGVSLVGKGINVIGNIPLVFEGLIDTLGSLPKIVEKEIAKKLENIEK
jgi:hypothetical protein